MSRRISLATFLLAFNAIGGNVATAAGPTTAPVDGLRQNTPSLHALVDVRIVVSPEVVIDKGNIILRDGLITAVGENASIPAGATEWKLSGKTVYPGFIDAYAEQTVEAPKTADGNWNAQVTPQLRVDEHYKPDAAMNKKLRGQGFAVRLVAPAGGIVKGTSTLATTADDGPNQSIVVPQAGLHVRLTPVRGPGARNYPASPMGAVALVRQTMLDARWYAQVWAAYGRGGSAARPEVNESLVALNDLLSRKVPIVVDSDDVLYFLRAAALAEEFSLPLVVRGSGTEYQRLDAVRNAKRPVLVPLNFPSPPSVAQAEAALVVPLERLMHWDIAPENPGRLATAGVPIALTTDGLKDAGEFWTALRKALDRGLSPEQALKAVTTTPAELFDIDDRYGTVAVGKAASLVVADGDLFRDAKAKIVETWVEGNRFVGPTPAVADLRGRRRVDLADAKKGDELLTLVLEGTPEKLTGKLVRGKKEAPLKGITVDGLQWNASLKGEAIDWKGEVQLSATILSARPDQGGDAKETTLDGYMLFSDGRRTAWHARAATAESKEEAKAEPKTEPKPDAKTETKDSEAKKDESDDKPKSDAKPADEKPAAKPKKALFAVNYPLGEYGVARLPEQPKTVAFTNAVVWTCATDGRLDKAVVIVESGKIAAVGPDVKVPEGATVVDLKGAHLTPGIIDCHSHIATDGGVNEATQSITAEVRIGDFIDPNDLNIYRQLAGGVTAANILHGSANTIGGQNQVIKFRWGALPEEMKFADAPPGIKFALGENVKQSNWTDVSRSRYPQSRMGVEQLLRDAFRAADDYRRRWTDYRRHKRGLPPRVDLEQEALVEVLEGKRLIHCHSYRQDEILAFLRVCEEFHIRVGTLQHVLEGYKVADAIAKHGAGGSTFSDWWAYKFEVWDAIPYNGALMHDAGVNVSFNSDDAELARRLNTEAAKAVKYGGVSPEEALKFVTLNPAKQLGIDARVGSIEIGKDADLAVWSRSPLSSYTRCEQTWIDGRKYFDRTDDARRRTETAARRNALIQRIIASGESPSADTATKTASWAREDIYCGCRSPHRYALPNEGDR